MNPRCLVVLAASFASAQSLPFVLQQALQSQPGLTLLDAPLVPADLRELKTYGYWPPWALVDLDGDGRQDIAAVVVKGRGQARMYGVIAVHASEPETIHWVVPLGKSPITGLSTGHRRGAVQPLFCFRCDTNPFYRWSGTAYEEGLIELGEQVELYVPGDLSYTKAVPLFAEGNRNSKAVASRKPCSEARVVERQGASLANRWYRVEPTAPNQARGWVPASSVAWGACIGIE